MRNPKICSRLIVPLLLSALLAGCTTSGTNSGMFGGKKLEVADVSNLGSYTAEAALAEGKAHFKNNSFGHAAAYYKRAVELAPKDPEGFVGLGASYDMLGRFDLADRVYAALKKLTGGTAQYYNNVGYSRMLRGDLKSAYVNFKKAQELAPDSIVVANNLQLLADAAAAYKAK